MAALVRLGFLIVVLPCSIHAAFAVAANMITKTPSCPSNCSGNNVSIPYPFGIGADCFISQWFEIVCNESDTVNGKQELPVLRHFNLEVLEILLQKNRVRVNYPVFMSCADNTYKTNKTELAGSPFVFSSSENSFIAMGCNNSATIWTIDNEKVSIGAVCRTPCARRKISKSSTNDQKILCENTDCCQTSIPSIPSDIHSLSTEIEPRDPSDRLSVGECRYAFLAEHGWFENNFTMPKPNISFPVLLDWGIDSPSNNSLPVQAPVMSKKKKKKKKNSVPKDSFWCHCGYPSFNQSCTSTCRCGSGFKGNPYLPQGCQEVPRSAPRSKKDAIIIGISTSLGLIVIMNGGWLSYKVVNEIRKIKHKKKFFKRNGGLLLQQQLSSDEANVETTNLFDSMELEKATDRFNVNRMLGKGGKGTVYKGMLSDGSIVAIKKSKIIPEKKLDFINEVVSLSRINHRNVVKLLGCCLETEVPLLIYEFIPNGTLSQYLNNQNEEFPPTWDMRLQIASDIAGALFYLHSATSSPIYHREIKSSNILLDEKYRAKIIDFGTSSSVAIDQTHLTTQVQGTSGYLDPESFQTGQFTEKSDVYSFGIVLVELLTGEKAITLIRTDDTKGLASYFLRSMEENNLFDILDDRVLKEGGKEVVTVANIAKRCLDLSEKKRPTMKDVSMELVAIQTLRKASNLAQQKYEEVESVGTEMYEQWADGSTSTT